MDGTAGARWHGTSEELWALIDVLRRYCSCRLGSTGGVRALCAPHWMIRYDQRALDGLVFGRRIAARLRQEEQAAPPGS